MDLKDIAYGLQTKFEVTCSEQADLIKAAVSKLYDQEAKNQVIEYHLEWLREKFDESYGRDDVKAELVQNLKEDLSHITSRCHKAEQENAEFRARSNATVVDAAQLAAENNSLRIEIATLRAEGGHLRDQIRRLEQKALDSFYAKNEAELSLFKYIKGEGKKEAAQ
jgi:uncharacterized coiled-coil protein SlyX